jgi:N-acetylglucosaminyl-diphospho-decaprenol L-rhamnosyltransferase
VVVAYNSRLTLRACVEPLCALTDVAVTVVDNASTDDSVATLADLPITVLALPHNRGFAYGCNAGWRQGAAPFVLFLNPDARIDIAAVDALIGALERPHVGIAAPRILGADGSLDFSQRRFPRLTSTYANAFFLHRVFAHAPWTSELVSDPAAYERSGSPDWASGACLLIRRDLLDELGGWDDGFFMYCEDKDICRRARDAGYDVRCEPAAVVHHEGGVSAPRASLTGVLAESRVRYARKHRGRTAAGLERAGIALAALSHLVVARGGRAARSGHAAALRAALRPAATSLASESRP